MGSGSKQGYKGERVALRLMLRPDNGLDDHRETEDNVC